ncbi:MAG: TlpA family protein disulfide reductase, partial [Nitrosomonadales bacterium]|nr:TlpA family protein disulfide reductase [Nitrosomonadales bacterium]
CRRDQDAVENLNREFAPQRLLVLAVNVGESRKKVVEYLQTAPRASKIVLTMDTNLAALYGNEGLPFYLMVDGDGKIVGDQRGAAGEEALRELLKKALPG